MCATCVLHVCYRFQHLNKGGAILGDSPGMGNPSGMEDQIAGDNHTPKLVTTPQPTATTGERFVHDYYQLSLLV